MGGDVDPRIHQSVSWVNKEPEKEPDPAHQDTDGGDRSRNSIAIKGSQMKRKRKHKEKVLAPWHATTLGDVTHGIHQRSRTEGKEQEEEPEPAHQGAATGNRGTQSPHP